MDTLTPASACRHSQAPDHHPAADGVRRPDRPAAAPRRRRRHRLGILNVQTLHTTTAVVVNEHEPLLLADFRAMLEAASAATTAATGTTT